MPSEVEASLGFRCDTQTDSRLQFNAQRLTLKAQCSERKSVGGGARCEQGAKPVLAMTRESSA
jgi:hypothetical protein